jgi:hypothetical protein
MDIRGSLVTAAAITVTVASFAFAVYADEVAQPGDPQPAARSQLKQDVESARALLTAYPAVLRP